MGLSVEAFSIRPAANQPAMPIGDAAGAGVAAILRTALERAGAQFKDATVSGNVQIGESWRGEVVVSLTGGGRSRHLVEGEFEQGHHVLFRMAEYAAHQIGLKMPEPAIHAFEDLRTPSPLAMLAYWEGLASEGAVRRAFWVRAFELDPHFAAARLALAQFMLDAGGDPVAAAGLAHGLDAHDAYAASRLGLDLWAAGAVEVAQELLQAAVRANPDDAIAGAALAALVARGLGGGPLTPEQNSALEEALLLATNATQHAADDYRSWAALADVHRAKSDFEQAGFYYGFALKLDPDAPTVLKDAGACWLLAHNPQQALPIIKHALEIAPGDAENYGNLAFARDLLHEPQAALDAARKAADLAPENARMRILHGDLALKAGRREEALDAWAQAAALEPGMTINPDGGNIGLPGDVPEAESANARE